MKDIKAALMGKELQPDGSVNHSSVATTPHLKLFVVTYQMQVNCFQNQKLVNEDIVDGISFWISGPLQRSMHSNLTALVGQLRNYVGSSFPIFTGGYVTYSSIGWTQPEPFYDLFDQSLSLYDSSTIQGFYFFAGSVLSKMNSSLWSSWDIPGHLDRVYQPSLGTVKVNVRDAVSRQPVPYAVATITYNGVTHVARKVPSASGNIQFGGWAGRSPVAHIVQIEAQGYSASNTTVHVQANQTISVIVELSSAEQQLDLV